VNGFSGNSFSYPVMVAPHPALFVPIDLYCIFN
jgi:hypothetical protein